MNDADRKEFNELKTSVAGCQIRIEEIGGDTRQTALSVEELRDNHLPHMEDRINKKIELAKRQGMWVYAFGVAVIGVIVACVGG